MAMNVKLIKKEPIKPASPTQDHLRTIPLSLVDHFLPPTYVSVICFYDVQNHTFTDQSISLRLKKSLSETLTRFFPLAGRIKGVYIDCNDEGAVFTEARVDCLLSRFLRNPDAASLEKFLPSDLYESRDPSPLLHVKVSFFESSGVAITVCVSHRICDAASLATFIRGWTATARGNGDAVMSPEFAGTTFFPPPDSPLQFPSIDGLSAPRGTRVTKTFAFDRSKIVELRRRAASERVPHPTRVEAVTALIWKCATKASRSNSASFRPSAMTQAMDLRRRIPSTHLPRNAIGNLIFVFMLKEYPQSEIEIREIVAKFRDTKKDIDKMIKEDLQGEGSAKTLGAKIANATRSISSELSGEMDLYAMTSWCGKGFYEADFGWGNPVWVAPGPNTKNKNVVYALLMDAEDGEGVEAWVGLPEKDMSLFEHDQELLAFATPNPTHA